MNISKRCCYGFRNETEKSRLNGSVPSILSFRISWSPYHLSSWQLSGQAFTFFVRMLPRNSLHMALSSFIGRKIRIFHVTCSFAFVLENGELSALSSVKYEHKEAGGRSSAVGGYFSMRATAHATNDASDATHE